MSTLSEIYRDHLLHLHHIIPLDFNSVRNVPDSHTWPRADDSPFGFHSDELSSLIPIVDLGNPDAPEVIIRACDKWGMFQLIGHGIALGLLEEVESEARRLFSLPAQQKVKALRSPDGATGYGVARIAPFFSKFMWHEGFTIMGSPVNHAREIWPHDYKHFCDVMEEYQKEMKHLSERILLQVLNSFNISTEEMSRIMSDFPSTALQLNSYPSCPDPNRAMGLAPHTDTSLLTILNQNKTNGLQIYQDGIGWVSVHPVSGALVVNIGDLLHILSNGRFPSVLHRAVVNEARHRLSFAYFYSPSVDTLISPLSELGPRRYRSLTVKEYVQMKAKHLEKALSLTRT